VVATFTDANPSAPVSDFTATITWGDGQSSPGTVSANSSGGFGVTGGHTYAEKGNYGVLVTIKDVGTATTSVNGTAAVADAPLSAAGVSVSTTAGAAFNGVVATFSDANPAAPVSDFTATITWGDGQSSPGSVIRTATGGFQVTGTHTYAAGGSSAITVTINDADGATVTATGSASVAGAGAGLTAQGRQLSAVEGRSTGLVTVATFVDPRNSQSTAKYLVEILWGDGSRSNGRVVSEGNGSFSVRDEHLYRTAGTFPVTVHITRNDGVSADASGTATVAHARLIAEGTEIRATAGVAVNTRVAVFADLNIFANVNAFTATIHWGDGTTSVGLVKASGLGLFSVLGSHTYARSGSFVVTVEISDGSGPGAVAKGSATVQQPDRHSGCGADGDVNVCALLAWLDSVADDFREMLHSGSRDRL
jgi:hypothetical protein